MRSRQISRLAKQQAEQLRQRGELEFEAVAPLLRQAMTMGDSVALDGLRPTGDTQWDYSRLYDLLRTIADRAGTLQRFDHAWQLLMRSKILEENRT